MLFATTSHKQRIPIQKKYYLQQIIKIEHHHSFGNATTAIYINYQQKKVDDANRKVIDYVLGK